MSDHPLSDRHRAFVREYLLDFNATAAATRAGYSPGTAKQQGSRLLTRADVARAIEAGKKRAENRVVLTKERLVSEAWDAYQRAISSDHYAGAGRLGELLTKLHGWGSETRNVRVIRDLADLSDAELQALVDSPEPQHEGTRH